MGFEGMNSSHCGHFQGFNTLQFRLATKCSKAKWLPHENSWGALKLVWTMDTHGCQKEKKKVSLALQSIQHNSWKQFGYSRKGYFKKLLSYRLGLEDFVLCYDGLLSMTCASLCWHKEVATDLEETPFKLVHFMNTLSNKYTR